MKKSLALLVFGFFPFQVWGYEWPVEEQSENILNTFGKSYQHHHSLMIKGIFIQSKKATIIKASENGKMIYQFNRFENNLPSSFGHKDSVVLQHSSGLKTYYINMDINPEITQLKNVSLIQASTVLGQMSFVESLQKYALFFCMHNQEGFIQPISLLKNGFQFQPQLYLDSIWLKSGIFQKIISSSTKNKNIILPLREFFEIYARVYEKYPSSRIEMTPKQINVSIIDTSNQQLSYENTIRYHKIIHNQLEGLYSAEQIYKKHYLRTYIYIGKWVHKQRLNHYQLTVSANSLSNDSQQLHFNISFR